MRLHLLPLLAALVAPACRAGATLPVPGSRARVEPGPHALELVALVEELEPRVVALLGTEWPRPYLVTVAAPKNDDWRAQTRFADRLVTIAPTSFDDDLAKTVAHELTHVHAGYRLEPLPAAVQEGIAWWVGHRAATSSRVKYAGPEPGPLELLEVLTLTHRDFAALAPERRSGVVQAATWLASRLLPIEAAK